MKLSLAGLALMAATAGASMARADTPVPVCRGHNPAGAAAARKEGLRHYRASKREGRGDAEMTTALGFFDAACAAGDDTSLELRAYALAGVERFVEAAQTLDAFLTAHPLTMLPADTRARVAAQQPVILGRVASLTVDSASPGARVSINHQAAGVTPLRDVRLAPGRYDVEVVLDGSGPTTRTLDLTAGPRTETFTAAPVAPPPAAVATNPAPGEPATHDTTVPHDAAPHGTLRPWVIGTGIGAATLLAAGVGGLVWGNNRIDLYDGAGCSTMNKAGCTSTLSEYHAARGIEVAGFVGGGLAAVATGVLYYLDARGHGATHTPAPLGLTCTVPGAGVICGATF